MSKRIAAAMVWLLVYSLTRGGPAVQESFPTHAACEAAGFKWLEGATEWQRRSGVSHGGPLWFCAESPLPVTTT